MNNINEVIIKSVSECQSEEIFHINNYVHEWHVQNHPQFFKNNSENDLHEYFKNSLSNEKHINLFAWINNKIVGYIQAEKKISNGTSFTKSSKTITINIIIVLPEFRKNGIGEKLYTNVLKYAKDNFFDRIEMNYWEGNENAPKFFQSMGFQPIRHFMYTNI